MKHIIIMGFKKVGKTTFAKGLAKDLNLSFLDIDDMIESEHEKKMGEKMSFREIAKKYGYDTYFRKLEHDALKKALGELESRGVIALGGGTALREENEELLKNHFCVNVMGKKDEVYKRIIKKGRPVFFPQGMGDRQAFDYLWDMRQTIYKKLANLEISFDGTLEEAVGEFKEKTGLLLNFEANSGQFPPFKEEITN
ncbi:MAG: shikimate kinase [bacterium]